jgi:dolichol-phosphate mannosyltransferase
MSNPYSDFNWCAIVPMANEEKDFIPFEETFTRVLDSLESGRVYLIVDNASRDRTLELCEALCIRDSRYITVWAPDNRNVVDAYLSGFKRALDDGFDIILEMDAGLSHDPRAIPMFLRVLSEGNEVAFGSRYINGGSMADSPLFRRFMSKGGTLAAKVLLGSKPRDMTSGFQGFHRGVLMRLLKNKLHSKGHFYQTEVRHLLRNTRWIEVPIHYRAPSPRVSQKAIQNSIKVLLYYAALRFISTDKSI